MGKVMSRSEKPEFFAKGGNEKMYEKGHSGLAQSGVSGKESNSNNTGNVGPENRKGELESYGKGFTFQKGGGSNEMFGKGHAGKKTPGTSGKSSQEG